MCDQKYNVSMRWSKQKIYSSQLEDPHPTLSSPVVVYGIAVCIRKSQTGKYFHASLHRRAKVAIWCQTVYTLSCFNSLLTIILFHVILLWLSSAASIGSSLSPAGNVVCCSHWFVDTYLVRAFSLASASRRMLAIQPAAASCRMSSLEPTFSIKG